MAVNTPPPDYELDDAVVLTDPAQVRALGHPLRTTILGLLHERAASTTELAAATERPKSTVAHHVGVLVDTGLVRVVRTRRVRAIDERFYGRTARRFTVGMPDDGTPADLPLDFNDFEVAASESRPAYEARQLWAFLRHARLSKERAGEFWHRLAALVDEFDRLPREGDTVYGFAVGIYPIADHPMLAEPAGTGRPRGTDVQSPDLTDV